MTWLKINIVINNEVFFLILLSVFLMKIQSGLAYSSFLLKELLAYFYVTANDADVNWNCCYVSFSLIIISFKN